MRLNGFVLVGLTATGLLVAASAQTFTYDNRTNQNSDGSPRFQDPDNLLENGTAPSSESNSGFSVKFSGSGFGQNGSTGADSRFVPSANGAFSTPFSGPNNMDTALGDRH